MESVQDLLSLGNILEDCVYRNDLKRKHEDDSVSISDPAQSPKKARTVNCLDYAAYLARVGSFTDSYWCRHALPARCFLLPHHLARHGWQAKTVGGDARFVQCLSCRECLYLKLPEVTSPTYRSVLARQESRVTRGHSEFCPWSSSPSPASWSLPITNTQEIRTNMNSLLVYGTDLPWMREDLVSQFRDIVDLITVETESADQRVLQSAAVLTVLGWQKGSLEETITDMFRVRRLGLWNFVSVQEELDRVEDLRVARELSGGSQDEEVSPRKKELEGKKYLDPIKEHLPWNPVVVKDEDGRAGWELVRDSFKTSPSSLARDSESDLTESNSVAGTVLSKVRALLELW